MPHKTVKVTHVNELQTNGAVYERRYTGTITYTGSVVTNFVMNETKGFNPIVVGSEGQDLPAAMVDNIISRVKSMPQYEGM